MSITEFIARLPEQLADAVTAVELDAATLPPSGVSRAIRAGQMRVDTSIVRGPTPDVRLELDEPIDARALSAAWRVERPVAVSPDVHQRTWSIRVAGAELPDPHGKRIASEPITAGRWNIAPRLSGRPAGDLPDVVSGASPAYDLLERGGVVASIEIAPITHATRTLDPADPDARELLAAMAAAFPAWHDGWNVDPAATFVAVYDAVGPVAGAALTDAGENLVRASQLGILRERHHASVGPALLDAIEAVASARDATRVRLDSSAFLYVDELPSDRYGYVVGPPYDGDTDVEVWAEKDLAAEPRNH